MEGAVKFFKGMVGLQPSMVAVVLGFIFFIWLAIVGNKLVCGWACPFGALQELCYQPADPETDETQEGSVPHIEPHPR